MFINAEFEVLGSLVSNIPRKMLSLEYNLNIIISEMALHFGLEYIKGTLNYLFRTENGKCDRRLVLSKNPKEIRSFFDYSDFRKDPQNVKDVCLFLVSSRFFNADLLDLTKTSPSFIRWLEVNSSPKHIYLADKSVYLIRIQNYFQRANILGELMRYAGEVNLKEQRLKKFNTSLVCDWVDDSEAEIGKIIHSFKNYMVKDLYAYEVAHGKYKDLSAFEYLLDIFTHEKIEEDFKSWYRSYA